MEAQVRILLVEPAKYQSLLIEREIHRRIQGAIVSQARTASEVLHLLRNGDIDIAIVDLDGGMDEGLGIVQSLSRGDARVKIIAIAGSVDDRVVSQIQQSGADELLVKDPSFHLIIPRLIEKLRRQNVRENLTGRSTQDESSDSPFESITTAAGLLAHEVNNPLMTILGTAELILEQAAGTDDELTRKMLAIRTSARRIRAVLKRLSISADDSRMPTSSGHQSRFDITDPVTK